MDRVTDSRQKAWTSALVQILQEFSACGIVVSVSWFWPVVYSRYQQHWLLSKDNNWWKGCWHQPTKINDFFQRTSLTTFYAVKELWLKMGDLVQSPINWPAICYLQLGGLHNSWTTTYLAWMKAPPNQLSMRWFPKIESVSLYNGWKGIHFNLNTNYGFVC